jgi:hypothetical protein
MLCQECLVSAASVHLLSSKYLRPATIEFYRCDYCSDCADKLQVNEKGPPPRRPRSGDLEEKLRFVKEEAETVIVDVLYVNETPFRLRRRHVMKAWIPPELCHCGAEFTVVMGRDAADGFYVDMKAEG